MFHRDFQTRENFSSVFECLETPMKHKAQVFEIASQTCIMNQEQWKDVSLVWEHNAEYKLFLMFLWVKRCQKLL